MAQPRASADGSGMCTKCDCSNSADITAKHQNWDVNVLQHIDKPEKGSLLGQRITRMLENQRNWYAGVTNRGD
jgi:hypothetical protein